MPKYKFIENLKEIIMNISEKFDLLFYGFLTSKFTFTCKKPMHYYYNTDKKKIMFILRYRFSF